MTFAKFRDMDTISISYKYANINWLVFPKQCNDIRIYSYTALVQNFMLEYHLKHKFQSILWI